MKLKYPIIFGRGTKVLTAYHRPHFKEGLMIAICESEKPLDKNEPVTDEIFRENYDGTICEMYFPDIEDLDHMIDHLGYIRMRWAERCKE